MSESGEHWHVVRLRGGYPTLHQDAGGQHNSFLTQAEAEQKARIEGADHSSARCLINHPRIGQDPSPPARHDIQSHLANHLHNNSSHDEAVTCLNQATKGNWSHQSEFVRRNQGRGFIGFLLTGAEDEKDLVNVTLRVPVTRRRSTSAREPHRSRAPTRATMTRPKRKLSEKRF